MEKTKIRHRRKIKLGATYCHDGMRGVAQFKNGRVIVRSGSDGFFPLDVLKWRGEIFRVNLKTP